MTRHLLLAAVASSLLACSDATAPATLPVETTLDVTQHMERIYTEQTIVFPVPRGCTGEDVLWTLRQESILHERTDANGGFHGTFTFHDMGSSGVGLVTGAQYRLAQVQNESFNVGSDQLPINDTAIFLRRFISQGSLSNFRVTNIFHYTIDANGTLTADHNTFERICN